MNEITFTKYGEQYASNPIFGNGNSVVKYQIGYANAGARLIVEHSFLPTSGFQLVLDRVAPQMPDYIIGTQTLPKGMYIRFRTNVLPRDVKVDISGNEGGEEVSPDVSNRIEHIDEKKYELNVVDELPPVGEAKENIIYSVKNSGKEEGNVRDEFIFVNGEFERIGSETLAVDEAEIAALFKKP